MLQYLSRSIIDYWRLRGIARKVRSGQIPKGVPEEKIWEALRVTKPKNIVEVFGALYAKVFNPDGTLREDRGLVSVKSVTINFAKQLVDALVSSGASATLPMFVYHKQGAGSTAEADSHTALIVQQVGATSGSSTHGTNSQIYQTVGTITAGSAYGCREHGIFGASTGGVLLDRSLVTAIDLNTDDVITWTYNLTVNAGG